MIFLTEASTLGKLMGDAGIIEADDGVRGSVTLSTDASTLGNATGDIIRVAVFYVRGSVIIHTETSTGVSSTILVVFSDGIMSLKVIFYCTLF